MDQANFLARGSGGTVLTLAGRSWRVAHLDWPRRQAHVEPAGDGGKTRWSGGAPGLGFQLCRAMLETVTTDEVPGFLSNRGKTAVQEL